MVAVLVVETVLIVYYSQFAYSTSARVYVYSTAQSLLVLATLCTLLAVRRERSGNINPEVVFITALFLAAHCVRIACTPFFPIPQNFLASGSVQTLLAFGTIVIHTSYGLAFSNMHSSALNADLSAALADAKEKDRQKIEVLGYIGHDLRAPLATISGYSSVLLVHAHESQRKLLQTIQRSVSYQLGLIDELLEYAKAELQPLAVKPVTTDLHLLLDDIQEYATALCSQQNNRFHYHAPDRMPRQISVDGRRLQQVLLNLLSNAAKFTKNGTVTLSVTAKPMGSACALNFAISDTGIGIDLSQNTDIFGAFQQIQAASGSTGLGLFIAQRIVSAMGGSLSVTSVYGEGSTFSFGIFVPVSGAPDAEWFAVANRQRESAEPSLAPTVPHYVMPQAQALDELAGLALHGRLTDIERWIEHHANKDVHAPFAARLRDLLEQFDFAAVHALALQGKNHSAF